jgi:hypothetical protein
MVNEGLHTAEIRARGSTMTFFICAVDVEDSPHTLHRSLERRQQWGKSPQSSPQGPFGVYLQNTSLRAIAYFLMVLTPDPHYCISA